MEKPKVIRPRLRIVKELESKNRKPIDPNKRWWLTPDEIAAMIKAASRHGYQRDRQRNVALVMLLYRHGLRVSELATMQWTQVNLDKKQLWIGREKGGDSGMHPLAVDEIAVLRALDRKSDFVLTSGKRGRLSRQQVLRIITKLGQLAKLEVHAHPHMLRHARGYVLVNKGVNLRKIQGFMGHKSIRNTQRYTALAASAYDGLNCHG